MSAVVVDASAVVEYLLRTRRAREFGAIIEDDGVMLCAPALCDVEIASVLRRSLLARRITVDRAAEVLADLADMTIVRYTPDGGR